MSDLVQKWKKLLDTGEPVQNEKNAAELLEDIQSSITDPENGTYIIPIFRRLLSDINLRYDPGLVAKTPISMRWSKELASDMQANHSIDIKAELINMIVEEVRTTKLADLIKKNKRNIKLDKIANKDNDRRIRVNYEMTNNSFTLHLS